MAFCGKCGSGVSDGYAFCPSCGNGLSSQSSSTIRAAVGAAPAPEKTFYQDQMVLITNSRCIVLGQTYAMSGITSVRAFTEVPSKVGSIILIIVGALTLLGSLPRFTDALGAVFFAVIMLAAGIAWFKSKKNIYHVVVHSASGESRLIHSFDQAYINKIINALNEAIVYRS